MTSKFYFFTFLFCLQSDRCRLAMLRPEELVQAHEETEVCKSACTVDI